MSIQIPQYWPVSQNSSRITTGSTFVAIKGSHYNGLDFIEAALANGAACIIADQAIPGSLKLKIDKYGAKLVLVDNARKALSDLSCSAWGNPQNAIKFIGITGTKGKTTTTYLTRHILKSAGHKTAMLTGVKNYILDSELDSELTTPHADYFFAFLASCAESGIEYVVMEVSAQALTLHRVDNIKFNAVVFTNLSQEHAEFYSSMQNYFDAKASLFGRVKQDGFALINLFDEWAYKLKSIYPNAITLGSDKNCDYIISDVKSDFSGLKYSLHGPFAPFDPSTSSGQAASLEEGTFTAEQRRSIRANGPFVLIGPFDTAQDGQIGVNSVFASIKSLAIESNNLFGYFNALNSADAFAVCLNLGIDSSIILSAIKDFTGVPGRMEGYKLPNGALGIVDYAHTPSSYEQVLSSLRNLTTDLIVVFGAGGDKDPIKRPIMGKIAAEFADKVVLTSDNPRNEDPEKIIEDIFIGVPEEHISKIYKVIDREVAINIAYQLSSGNSIILVLGKGPDEYQIIKNQKFYFSDKSVLLSC